MAELMQLEGFKELAAKLKQMPEKVARNALRRAVSTGAARVRDTAKVFAPEDTGEMKRDIQVKRERDNRNAQGMVARYSVFVRSGKKSRLAGKARDIDKDSFYWKFIEFGTSKMGAQPFLLPAFDAEREDAVEDIGAILGEFIQQEASQ